MTWNQCNQIRRNASPQDEGVEVDRTPYAVPGIIVRVYISVTFPLNRDTRCAKEVWCLRRVYHRSPHVAAETILYWARK